MKQPTFRDPATGFAAEWRLRNGRRNSTQKTCHYAGRHAGLGGASDWLKQIFSRGMTNQKHYPDLRGDMSSDGISELISQTSFTGETSGDVTKCRLFSQAIYIIRDLSRSITWGAFVLFSGTSFNISGNMAKDDIYILVSRSRYCLFVFRIIFWSKILTLEQNCLTTEPKWMAPTILQFFSFQTLPPFLVTFQNV